jgi:hypothetical protein
MPQITFPFDLSGMFVDVMIAPSGGVLTAMKNAGKPFPSPVWGKAMIDTGTNVSAVSIAILESLGIQPESEVETRGIGGEMDVGYYEVSLTIMNRATGSQIEYAPPDVKVIGIDVPDIDALIGLDLLIGCRMMFDGPGGEFSLHF